MTRKIMACGQIAAGFAAVFAGAISDTEAQPIVGVEDCGKTPVFVCAESGYPMGEPPLSPLSLRQARPPYLPLP